MDLYITDYILNGMIVSKQLSKFMPFPSLLFRTSVVLLWCLLEPEIMQIEASEVKRESCHITFTMLVRATQNPTKIITVIIYSPYQYVSNINTE